VQQQRNSAKGAIAPKKDKTQGRIRAVVTMAQPKSASASPWRKSAIVEMADIAALNRHSQIRFLGLNRVIGASN
jgi:hypothetical protein